MAKAAKDKNAQKTSPSSAKNKPSKKPESNAKVAELDTFVMDPENEKMTTDHGVRISHTIDSLKAGTRGPTLMEDFHLREKIMHFDHERIPERVVHARGSGAHGVFESYGAADKWTKAGFLSKGRTTPVFVRFSTVVGSRGSADTARDVRGFAVKFYTDEGVFDLVGNNIPIFFIQDGIKFPDLVHAVKPEPHHEMPQASSAHDTFWDFASLTPESTHMLMWLLSDRAIPRSYSTMQGFGVHTFKFVNEQGKARFVKFHWTPLSGVHSLLWDEAMKLMGKDADFHRRGLWEMIEEGNFPEWELGVQVIEEKDEEKLGFDLLDPTKVVPEEMYPVIKIGKMTLNKNTENFFAETEQVAFHIGNLVPGIDLTNDPLLQARLFSYLDTQINRFGTPNFNEIPINRSIAKVVNHQQDGAMRTSIYKGRANYFPNSLGGNFPAMASAKEGGYVHHAESVSGTKTRERSESFNDHYSQATLFFNSLSDIEKEHLIEAGQFELGKVATLAVRERVIQNFLNVDPEMAAAIAAKVGVKLPGGKKKAKASSAASPALSQMSFPGNDLKGRNIAVLIEDGFNYKEFKQLETALKPMGAKATLIATKIGTIKSQEGEEADVGKSFLTCASVMFDGVYIPGGKKSIAALSEDARALLFISEAFKHQKSIGASSEAETLLDQGTAEISTAPGVFLESAVKDFVKSLSAHRHWDRDTDYVPA